MLFSRLIEQEIKIGLKTSGAVLVSGPKFCGKSTTCSLLAKSSVSLNTDSMINDISIEPRLALMGDYPRLIDEWQKVPDLWNYVKEDCSKTGDFGMYILTGSATPPNKTKIHHSGAGRIVPIIMKPLSLYESLESKGSISLNELFKDPNYDFYDLNDNRSLNEVAHGIVRGGWPQALKANYDLQTKVTQNYFRGLFNFHETDNQEFRKLNPDILLKLLQAYARNISTEVSNQTLIDDVIGSGRKKFDYETFLKYSNALKDLFIIYDMDAWNPSLRSKTAVRTTPVRHFFDPSIACMALNIWEKDLIYDLNTMGLLFEDMVARDISIYSMSNGGKLSHYRDSDKLECDIVLHINDGSYALIEVKLGGEKLIEDGIRNLIKLKNKLDLNKEKLPSFMAVITAKGPAYKSKEGVYVIPINLLKD